MENRPCWLESAGMPRVRALDRNLVVDVVVIGGGITGVTAAYLLKQSGLRVALLERGSWGGVDTSYTTAHLTWVTDQRLHQLARTFGRERAKAVWEAGFTALHQIATQVEAEDIACEFQWVPGYLHTARNADEKDDETLLQDAALAQELGFPAQYCGAVPYFDRPGVCFLQQAKFHPLKYVSALLRKIPGQGSHVFAKTEAREFVERPLTVRARDHEIACRYLIIATHTPLMGNTPMLAATFLMTKLYLYTSYALGAKLASGLVPEALFWDTESPYHYLRVDQRRGSDYAIFGGEDHKTGQAKHTEQIYSRLQARLRRSFPAAVIKNRWSGQVVETNDGLPFIGETAENQFVATGFAGNGMTFGTLGAMMAVDACFKRENRWAELFSPHRTKLRGGTWTYLSENKDYPFYLVRNWMAGARGKSLRALKRGTGKIMNLDGTKVAAYRDSHGHVSVCSPVCPHLGCTVAWNDAEQTWDCPCHGSRFMPDGRVLSGPAEKDLEKIQPQEPVANK